MRTSQLNSFLASPVWKETGISKDEFLWLHSLAREQAREMKKVRETRSLRALQAYEKKVILDRYGKSERLPNIMFAYSIIETLDAR